MTHAAAYSILALTVGLALARPRVWRVRVQPASAAVLGAVLTVATGLIGLDGLLGALSFLSMPVVTIVSLMVITLVAEQAGLFKLVATRVARAAGGDAKRLFTYLFFTGAFTGMLFTNDAAVLIFTPLVFNLVQEVKDSSWGRPQRIAYYFAVLHVANLVAPLVIGNPINIIVAGWFDIGFLEYAKWMVLPAVTCITVTYFGLRFCFRKSLPASYRIPEAHIVAPENRRFLYVAGVLLALTLAGFFSESWTGIPTAAVAAGAAVVMLVLYRILARGRLAPIGRGVGWDVIVFVCGIFIVARGLANAGFTDVIGTMLAGLQFPSFGTAFISAFCSSVLNNHPVADLMAVTIGDLDLGDFEQKRMAFSALIGGDLGPKMLPIGSLAALLWFRILRDRGEEITYREYIVIGVPVTLVAIFFSVAALHLSAFLLS